MEFEEDEQLDDEEEPEFAPLSHDDSPGNPPATRPSPAAETAPSQRKTKYKECLKNHAVAIGGHAVDGCGEFIPAGDDGTLESLKCAACNCHRNFHRRDTAAAGFPFHGLHHGRFGYLQPRPSPTLLALPSTSGGGASEMEDYYSHPGGSSGGAGKKRFRTKFTQDQKEKMLSLATRLGWRIQKQDEETVEQFCNEVGIRRQVLKVWMHNNKNTLGKKT